MNFRMLPIVLLISLSRSASAVEWYLRATDESASTGRTVTTLFVDGSVLMQPQDPDGHDMPPETQVLPQKKFERLRDLSYASQVGNWKTEPLCPGKACSAPTKSWFETRSRTGQIETVLFVDGIASIVKYRDNPAVKEIRKIMDEEGEGNRFQ